MKKYLFILFLIFFAQSTEAAGMKQLIIGGYNDALSATAVEYNSLQSGYLWTTTANNRKQVVSTGGTFSNLAVELSAAAGSGGSYTIKILNVTDATSLDVTITDTATTNINTGTLAVSAGDVIELESSDSGASATPTARWTVIFTSDVDGESLILHTSVSSASASRYQGLAHGNASSNTAAAFDNQIIPTGGSIKNLYVNLAADPGTDPDKYTITLVVDGSDSALACTITDPATTCNDTDSVAVTAGQDVLLRITPADTPSTSPVVWAGMTFVATTNGESLILGAIEDVPTASATEYTGLTEPAVAAVWGTTESAKYQGGHNAETVVLKKLYVENNSAPTASETYAVRATSAGGNTGITCTIVIIATCNDILNTYTIGSYDELNMAVTVGVGTARRSWWGLVSFIEPAAGGVTPVPTPPQLIFW